MKRFLLYILLIINLMCYGQHYTMHSTSMYNIEKINQPTIHTSNYGYTTKYGYVQNNDIQDFYNYDYNSNLTYNSYESAYESDYSHPGKPRRAIGDHESGSETITVDGYTAIISWSVDANIIGLIYWTITYSDGTQETYWGSKSSAINHAKSVAREKAREKAEKMASHPDDPFADPVGEFPIGLLLILMFSYLFYKINNKRTKNL